VNVTGVNPGAEYILIRNLPPPLPKRAW